MMKELKAVRDWKDAAGVDSRLFLREVNALVKAVREDAAKLCEAASSPASITNAGAFYAHIIRNGKMEHGKYLRDKQAAIRRK